MPPSFPPLVSASLDGHAWGLAVALGIGLLLGVERERRKGRGPRRQPAGVRTFALVALLGGIAMVIGSAAVVAVAATFVAGAAIAGYVLDDRQDPGLTTEVALVIDFLLGALAQEEPALAAGTGVVVAVLLASRERLHAFVRATLSEEELHDALLFAAAALVVLPLVPDRAVGPFEAFNPFTVWRLVVIVMAVSAAGYVAVRMVGPRFGLPLAGFASGFVSSAATVGSLGGRAARNPKLLRPAVAGAALSTVATVLQAAIVVGATSRDTLVEMALPLALAGAAALSYGLLVMLRVSRDEPVAKETGRAFELRTAIIFAGTVTAVLFLSAAVHDWQGEGGLALATGLAGFADAHAAAISAASLAAAGKVTPADAVVPILAGFSTNTVTKLVVASVTGRRPFATEVGAGLFLVIAGFWGGLAVARAS